MPIFDTLFGTESERTLKPLRTKLPLIAGFEDACTALSDDGLKAKTEEFRARLAAGETLDDLLPEAFAVVREAARRTLGQRHYDVQMLGGMVLHSGAIAEMRTGEGKTLVATLPAYLNALPGKGVHVVTVNDYLSRRDGAWMGQVYAALGLTLGVINNDSSYLYDPSHSARDEERDEEGSFRVFHEFLRPVTRREAYAADITYGTNSEFGFDYLRDNISYMAQDLRQREPFFAIVDEIDSILIDEARTPLIISAPDAESSTLYATFAQIVDGFVEGEDYTIDEKRRQIQIAEPGIEKAEKALGLENMYTEGSVREVHHLENAVRAKALYHNDREYVVRKGEIVIVDEFTGRLQPGRRWSEGLHQAIEAKEGVKVQDESRTMASVTYQNYFRLYPKLGGMTGTAETSAEEFTNIYGLSVVMIPPHRPSRREDKPDLIFGTEKGKHMALARRIKELHDVGQPVLIGTASVEKNELLAAYLTREGVPHEVLNAKNHEREGEIIAQAGRKGSVVIATNMAGRGVDIKLGGNPSSDEEYQEIVGLGGLAVIGTERHEARRIDNQLRGRAGRQGDPGETQFFVSMEDTLMRVFAADTMKGVLAKLGIPEDQPITHRMISRELEAAQAKIEGFHFDARKAVLQYDNVIDHQRRTMYARRRTLLLGAPEDVRSYIANVTEEGGEAGVIAADAIARLSGEVGEQALFETLRRIALQTNDLFWVDHLELMDNARESVNLRAYGQRDPIVEYKREAVRLYKEMEASIRAHLLEMIPRIQFVAQQPAPAELAATEASMRAAAASAGKGGAPDQAGGAAGNALPDVGRNDLCPCGSGKKYKKCHGA